MEDFQGKSKESYDFSMKVVVYSFIGIVLLFIGMIIV